MNDLKQFFKNVPRAIWWIVGGCVLLICLLPAAFTKLPSIIDFTETGQIGDTIGGTMGPFIAIVAALLTFIAFWAQFEANRELINENRRNHFENRFYKMLDMHLESVDYFRTATEKVTHSVFRQWCDDIMNSYNDLMIESDFGGFLSYIRKEYKDEPTQQNFLAFIHKLEGSLTERQKVMFEIAYTLFFMGSTSSINYGDDTQTTSIRRLASLYTLYVNEKHTKESFTFPAMNETLGRYYRHLFQIVKYVDGLDDDLYEEKNWKNEFIGLLRSQMSDYEQVLLYYNAQSSIGAAWNEKHYIERYRLIKNIPFNIVHGGAGIPPIEQYKEAIKEAESRGIVFFENS